MECVEELDLARIGGRFGGTEEVDVEATARDGRKGCRELLLDPDATLVSFFSSSSDDASLLSRDLLIRPGRAAGDREGRGCSSFGAGGGGS